MAVVDEQAMATLGLPGPECRVIAYVEAKPNGFVVDEQATGYFGAARPRMPCHSLMSKRS